MARPTAEIARCAVQIDRAQAEGCYGDILTLLCDLQKAHIKAEQLEDTGVVRVLYRLLRTCSDGRVKKTAKSLLSKWKRQYRTEPELSQRKVSSPNHAGDVSHCSPGETPDSQIRTPIFSREPGLEEGHEEDKELEKAAASCSSISSVRSKCVQLLLSALCPEPSDQQKASDLATDIEKHIHEIHKSNQVKYKACVRSKLANLRNPKSAHLRRGLLAGSLAPEAFVRMSVEEMACPELRRLREEHSSQAVSERQLPQSVEGTQTQKVRCRRCGGWDCRVTQVSRGALFLPAWVRQSGADDDAMTFVTCASCGQQWYHSGWVCL